MQGNNSGYMNGNNNNMHMNQERFNNLQAQLQQHLNNGGYLHHPSQNGGGNISGTGMVGIGGNMGNHHIVLSELPEPPISVNEIGPIPPPPMFSTPSPTMVSGRPHGPGIHEYDYDSAYRFFHYSHSVDSRQLIFFSFLIFPHNFTDDEPEELDSDDEYYGNQIDTTKVDEIPAREPKFNAVPLKSALKKKTSNPGTPTQDNRTLAERQANSSFK